MKKIVLTLVLIITGYVCVAQIRVSDLAQRRVLEQNSNGTLKLLWILRLPYKQPIITENVFIDADIILNMERLPDILEKEFNKLLEVDQVINVWLKPNASLLTLNDVFNLYKIPAAQQKLPIMVSGDFIYHPETLLISKNQINSVKLLKNLNGGYISIKLKTHRVSINIENK
jgi:hypothetical protein